MNSLKFFRCLVILIFDRDLGFAKNGPYKKKMVVFKSDNAGTEW
jgi:hypothetical protein